MRTVFRVIGVVLTLALSTSAAAFAGAAGDFGASAGMATGDNGLDTGWIIGGDYTMNKLVGPIKLRGDVTYQSHNPDFTMWGVAANAVLPLTKFYALAGLGYYSPDPGDSKIGFQVGGGMHLLVGMPLFAEVRVVTMENFTTIPLVVGVRI